MWGMVKTKFRSWVALRFCQRVLLKCINSDFSGSFPSRQCSLRGLSGTPDMRRRGDSTENGGNAQAHTVQGSHSGETCLPARGSADALVTSFPVARSPATLTLLLGLGSRVKQLTKLSRYSFYQS